MDHWNKSVPSLLVGAAAALAIPFYLGLVHWTVANFVVYSAGASAALTAGDFLDAAPATRGGSVQFLLDAAVWFALVIGIGLLAYSIALLF